jgi:hypothetical protein
VVSVAPFTVKAEFLPVSPDGHSLAFAEGDDKKVRARVIPLDGAGLTVTMPYEVNGGFEPLGWHHDGRSFIGVPMNNLGTVFEPRPYEIWRIPVDKSPRQPLGISGTNIIYGSMSPDGRAVAYSTQAFASELWMLKPTDGH